MKQLNEVEMIQVSGGLHPSLKMGVLSVPFIGAMTGAIEGFKLSTSENPAQVALNCISGASIGYVVGLVSALGISRATAID